MSDALAAAWPVPWTEDHRDFELRASPESSNRGNCIRPRIDRPGVEAMLSCARPFFERHARPLQVVVPTSFVTLDEQLASLQFQALDPSLLMSRRVTTSDAPKIPDGLRVEIDPEASPRWLHAWRSCARPGAAYDASSSILRHMRHGARFVALYDGENRPLAVGSSIVHDGWRCLGNLATRPDARGKGFASLVLRILSARSDAGATHDILQVDDDSLAAALYRRHGFETAYRYHYRRSVT